MKLRFFTAAILLASLTGATHAALTTGPSPTTYVFSGFLDNPFGSLPAGTPFSGSFTYDGAQPLNVVFTDRGDYLYENFSVTILGAVANSGMGVINMYDHPAYPTDLFHLYTLGLTASFGGITLAPDAGMQLVLQNTDGDVFSDLSVLKPNLTLADFTSGGATFLELQGILNPGDPGPITFSRGQLTSLRTVPEPSSLYGSVTLAGLILLRRRRSGRVGGGSVRYSPESPMPAVKRHP